MGRRSLLVNAGLLLATLAILWILLEIVLRLAGISHPYFTQIDTEMGFALRPFAEGWSFDEGNVFIRINSDGLRDREYVMEKPANVLRIAVLGDSYTEARQVALTDTFWYHLERELDACPALGGKDVEVINFGVSGFSTAQELQMLRSRAWMYQPDIVLLAFLSGNDVKDNSPVLSRHDREPFFREENGQLVLDTSFRETAFFRGQRTLSSRIALALINRSRVLQLTNRVRIILRNRWQTELAISHTDAASTEAGLDPEIYEDPPKEQWEEAWRMTEKILRLMHREVREHGAAFAVVGISNGIQVHPDVSARDAFAKQIGVPDLLSPERRIGALAGGEGFWYLPLVPFMQRKAEETKTFFHGFPGFPPGTGHWNEHGHRVAGTLIAEFLCEKIRKSPRLGL